MSNPGVATADSNPDAVLENLQLYWTLQAAGAFIALIPLALIPLAFGWRDVWFEYHGIAFNSGPTLVLWFVLYLGLSLKTVPANEHGGAYWYGRALKRLASGLQFVPFALVQVRLVSRLVQEFQAPAEPEKVFKDDDKKPLPEGMVRAIRVLTRAPKKGETGVLDHQMTVTLSFATQYAVRDILDFIANYGSFENVEKQLRDIGETTLAEAATQETPAGFIQKLPELNQTLVQKIRDRFKASGIEIISVRNIAPDISHEVSGVLADTPIKRAQAEQTVIAAGAERARLEQEGIGTASAKLATLEAQAKGRKAIADALKVSGEAVLASEAVATINEKADVVVLGTSGMADAMGLVKSAQAVLGSSNKKKGATP